MDDHDRTVLDRIDHHLDPLVPTAPAPVTDLVRRGRAARTRRRGLQAGLAAAVAVVAAATTTAVVQGRDAAAPLTPAASTPAPSVVDPTTRTVGLDGIVVDVPADWVARPDCRSPEEGAVFASAPAACDGPRLVMSTGLTYPDILTTDGPTFQHGLEVRREPVCESGVDGCAIFGSSVQLGFPDANRSKSPSGQQVEVFGPDSESIAQSARPVPDGSVVVPDVEGLGLDEAKALMSDAGLETLLDEPYWIVGRTDPEAGSVVPLGTFVDLPPQDSTDLPPTDDPTPDPPTDDTRTIGLDTLAVDVPADWVATGVRLEEPIDGDVRGTCNLSGVSVGSPSTAGNCTSTSFVEMDRLDVSYREGGTAIPQAGLDLRRRDDVCPPGNDGCLYPDDWTTVWVEGEPLGLVIVTDDDALLEQIVASVRPVPDGFVAVPHVDGERVEGATDFLGRAGLETAPTDGDYVVGSTVPEAGSVVPVGSEVTLAPIAGADDDNPAGFQPIDYGGVAVSVPDRWVSCPVVAMFGYGPARAALDADGDCSTSQRTTMTKVMQTDTDRFGAPFEQGGLTLRTWTGREPGSDASGDVLMVLAVDEQVIVRITSPEDELVDAIRDSIRAAG